MGRCEEASFTVTFIADVVQTASAIVFTVTLPLAWPGLLAGTVLSFARAMGEFGAVSVVSGHIRGRTNTLPLHVEVLHSEYQAQAAFAVATLLTLLALVTLVLKTFIERKSHIR